MRFFVYTLFIYVFIGITSCSKGDYTNAIPANSTLLLSINAADMETRNSPILSVFNGEQELSKAIDLTKEIYMFAAGDGNLGVCAAVNDLDNLNAFFLKGMENGILRNHIEYKGTDFYTFNNQWILGGNNSVILVMGPVTGAEAETKLIRRMSRLMALEEETSVRHSSIWEHLQEHKGNMTMVAQANALPNQIESILTLGAPKGSDSSDILLEAEITYSDSILFITGNTCSYKQNIRQALVRSRELYNPIAQDWSSVMGDSTLIGVFMNIKGEEFMPLLQTNKALNALLMGTDAYDEIRRSNGNIAILFTQGKGNSERGLFDATVISMPSGTEKGRDKLIAAVNIAALVSNPLMQTVAPFFGEAKQVVFNMRDEE